MPWSFHTWIGESAREGYTFRFREQIQLVENVTSLFLWWVFPAGTRTLPKRDKREFYSHCNADWLNINFGFDSFIRIIKWRFRDRRHNNIITPQWRAHYQLVTRALTSRYLPVGGKIGITIVYIRTLKKRKKNAQKYNTSTI